MRRNLNTPVEVRLLSYKFLLAMATLLLFAACGQYPMGQGSNNNGNLYQYPFLIGTDPGQTNTPIGEGGNPGTTTTPIGTGTIPIPSVTPPGTFPPPPVQPPPTFSPPPIFTPPVFSPPPVTPPVLPSVVPSVTPPNPNGPPTVNITVPNNGSSYCGQMGQGSSMLITLTRTCSNDRAGSGSGNNGGHSGGGNSGGCSPGSNCTSPGEYFEDAVHPIVSVEANGVLIATIQLNRMSLTNAPGTFYTVINFNAIAMCDAALANAQVSFWVCDDITGDGRCSDKSAAQVLNVWDQATIVRMGSLPEAISIPVYANRGFSAGQNPLECDDEKSPVVLDLTGNGINTTGASSEEGGVMFDLADTGKLLETAWLKAPTLKNIAGFLVRDLNGNGKIDNGGEMFGNYTKLKNGQDAANGFAALLDLDSNNDGFFDYRDAAWNQIKVWIDNQDGVTEGGELHSLNDLGIAQIDLHYVPMFDVDQYNNTTRQRSTFTMFDRSSGQWVKRRAVDIWFAQGQ